MSETTIILVSPNGNAEVWAESDIEAKLAEGYKTYENWLAEYEAEQQIIAEQEAEQARIAHEAWLADPANKPVLFRMLREKRDAKLGETDYLLAADYPVSPEKKEAVVAYRQALRDLPSQEGAPWDGGGDATPWPEKP